MRVKRERALKLFKYVPGGTRKRLLSQVNYFRISKLRRNPMPKWITLFITNYCNARCHHCFYWHELNSKARELTLEELENTLKPFMKNQLRTIHLSGGEPFLRKDLADFYHMVDRHRITSKLSIPTNGMLEVLPSIEKMITSSRNKTTLNVSVSLDGLEDTHNYFRGIRNGFEKAIDSLRRMVELSKKYSFFHVSACTTVTQYNMNELPELVRFVREELGIRNYGFDHVRNSETDLYDIDPSIVANFHPPTTEKTDTSKALQFLNTENMPENPAMLDIDQIQKANEMLQELIGTETFSDKLLFTRLELERQIKKEKRRVIPCLAGRVDCTIYPNGDVSVCEFTKPFANLKDFDFDFMGLWKGAQAEEMRVKTERCGCTHPCNLSDSMAFDTNSLLQLIENPACG